MVAHGCGDPPGVEEGIPGREDVSLPEPRATGPVPLEEALEGRRSVRDFRSEPLDLHQVAQLLWAAQGVTGPRGLRSVPSAGALYPLEVHLVVGGVEELEPGVYRFDPDRHTLTHTRSGDRRDELAAAALGQDWMADAPVMILVTALFERTTSIYGERGVRYVHMEVGHAAQNVYLQAVAMGLGTTLVGAFRDDEVRATAGLRSGEAPLGILPVGAPRPEAVSE